ncbi:MAG: hypothetical protein Q7J78_02800 [Clostridiales bacterium]|nr:hypothetical protein [Clostridiales bacterium]
MAEICYLHPTAGCITDMGSGGNPEPISAEDRAYLRNLAKRVADIASKPIQQERRRLWTAHNDLKPVRPMYVCYPEGGWNDLLKHDELRLTSPMWRNCEWYLRHLIYRDEMIDDDFVVEPEIVSFIAHEIKNEDSGMPVQVSNNTETGAYVFDAPLKEYRDIKKLKLPELNVDMKLTEQRFNAMQEEFRDILEVNPYLTAAFTANQPGKAALLRGVEQIMWDMYDAPEFLHELMDFLTRGYIKLFKEMEATGLIRLNNRNQYVDAGGNGYTSDMPGKDYNPSSVKLYNVWGYGVAQEFSEISPEMHEEFGIRYQARVLEMFGLNAYGCCESYTRKFDILKGIPRLRRVSVSPWCDIEAAAEKLGKEIIYSWKPNPAIILFEQDWNKVRAYIRRTLEVAKDCVLEMFLKDIIHLRGYELRISEFSKLMREQVERSDN